MSLYTCEYLFTVLQVKACAEQTTIHSAVFTMLEQIRQDVSDDEHLSQFIADLYADIKSHNWNKKHKVFVYLFVC